MKRKKIIKDIKLTEEDVEVSLLQLKRKVGPPKINFRKKR